MLLALHQQDGCHQRWVGERVALDKSPSGDVITSSAGVSSAGAGTSATGAGMCWNFTADGRRVFAGLTPKVNALSEQLLAGLSADEAAMLEDLLARLVLLTVRRFRVEATDDSILSSLGSKKRGGRWTSR